jgi:hypothetical protein
MSDDFTLTRGPVRVTAAIRQPLQNALLIQDYDQIDALLGFLAIEGSGTATIRVLTAMQNETEDGWVTLFTFANQTTANGWDLKSASAGILKYIRWEVTSLGGATAITFQISGMLRSHGG